MALPIAGFYTSTGGVITTHDFGSVEAGAYKPSSSGWSFRLYNAYGSTSSDTMTSVKMSTRDTDGGVDEIWTTQHWIQIKSSSGSTGVVDDAQTVFTAVGKNKELSLGDIPSGEYRTLYARCYPPTDAAEQDVDFQLRATYQQPATSICSWITGLRGNGVVASTGDPFAMSTGGTTGTIPYESGYALIYNNEIYYGSSGTYDCSTGSSGANSVYLNESGAFGMTTGSVAANQLLLYEATISSGGVCTNVIDKRVYLAGLQAGTTGAIPTTPDLGDLYLDTINGKLYAAKTAGTWTVIVPGATFVALTDTPANYTGDANKFLSVSTGEDAIEFVTPTATEIEVSEIGTATYDDVQDFIDNTQSGGSISGGTITDDSSGGIAISSGTGFTKTTTGNIGLTKSFDWAAGTLVSTGLTDNSTNYIYMDYNATGSPQILATADRTTIRLQDQFTLGRVYKSGTDIHVINSGVNLYNAVRRMHEVKIEVQGFQRASGGVISGSAVTERALNSTVGIFFLGDNEIITSAKNTSTGGSDYFTSWYYINSAWTSSTGQQQIDNTQYNNPASTGLETLTAGRYGVHWTYVHYDGDLQTVYGQGDYTITQAENASVPDSLPSVVSDFGTIAAKIILQKGSTGFTSVVTAYEVPFPVSSPSEHNDLGGLDTADYQHLTQAEHDIITSTTGVGTDYLSATGGWTTPTGATGGEANTASNAGTTGIGIYYQKSGVDLEFKAIHSTGGNISVTDSTGTTTVNLDVISTGIKLDDLGTPDDNTDLNATTGHHGLLLKLTGSTSTYLNADGAWATPPGATGGATNFLQLTDTPANYTGDASKILRVNASSGAVEFVSTTGIATDTFGPLTDITTNNATTGEHGFLPKRDGDATHWLDGAGLWTAPTASEVGALELSGAFTVNRIPQITSTGGVIKASPFAVTTGDVFNFGAHSAGFTEQAIAISTGATAIDWNNGLKALYTRSTGAAGAATFSFTAPVKSANLMLTIRGSTEGSTGTVTWPAIKWDGGSAPSLGSGVSAINVVSFYYSTGLTSYLGQCSTGTFSS